MIHFPPVFGLDLINSNIEKYGHHIYLVSGGVVPRFAYSIGAIKETGGYELILAGAIYYSAKEAGQIINEIKKSISGGLGQYDAEIIIEGFGSFRLRKVDPSWIHKLMFGALDFHKKNTFFVWQIIPDGKHFMVDVPNMEEAWNADKAPVWQWLDKPWGYHIPSNSKAITNLAALYGEPITEASHWEEAEWELFAGAGPDVMKSDMRVVPLGTLLALDKSLITVTELKIGHSLWREGLEFEWQIWG